MPETHALRSGSGEPRTRLASGLRALGLAPNLAEPLLAYLAELAKWNHAYNLTAIRDLDEMVTRHLLDSLAVLPVLDALVADQAEPRFIDIGAGAGLPGIPLAIARPGWTIAMLDSNGKKARFLRHAVRTLKLANVEVFESRAEDHQPARRYDFVISRAFAALGDFLAVTGHLPGPGGKWLAMKGKLLPAEHQGLPAEFNILDTRALAVPGLDEQRHLVIAARTTHADP